MTPEEIKKGAPDVADGYCFNCDGLWYWRGNSVWFNNQWIPTQNPSKSIKPLP